MIVESFFSDHSIKCDPHLMEHLKAQFYSFQLAASELGDKYKTFMDYCYQV